MKKLIVILIALCLFGCEESIDSKLQKLGYNQENIEMIKTYPEDIQDKFLNVYNYKYVALMNEDNFDINKLDEYMNYYGLLENKELISLINNNDGKYTINQYIDLLNDEYYIESNKQLYLEYLDSYNNIRDLVEAINTKTYLPYYTDIEETDVSKGYLMLINKYHRLSSDFEPDDLVEVEPEYGRGRTRRAVYDAYKALQDEANELGYHFKITSAYRAYDVQYGLYQGYLEDEGGDVDAVDRYSARPGHSEHQSGLCLDLSDAQYGMDNFGLSEASKWVNENCYKYGFIIRYTEDKEAITGYQAEPWQIRYVGDSIIAKDIMDRGITFDEYYAYFVENN